MNKEILQVAEAVSNEKGVSPEIIFEAIKLRLGDGDKVQITGFGTFLVRQKRERRGRNPQTGEEMVIKPRSSVVFRPSKLFTPVALK